ncbi:hypothetical protein JTB14_005641 [Gonioctena quinquepunctata]|nr:hypothetical protein JTB14_005641 [Gonioctena quinquepunctata]
MDQIMDQMMHWSINDEAVANSDQEGDSDAEDGIFFDSSTPSTSKRATRPSSSKINLCNSNSGTEDEPYSDNSDMDLDFTLDKKSLNRFFYANLILPVMV